MPASNALVEQRQEFAAKQKELAEVFELAKDGAKLDFSRKTVLEKLGATDAKDATDKVRARNDELSVLGDALRENELKHIREENLTRGEDLERPVSRRQPGREEDQIKTLGQLYIESKQFIDSRANKVDIPFSVEMGVKTLFQTSAGFAPESVRSGVLVEGATRPIQVADLIPSFTISQPSFVYMEETTRTHAAAEKAEGVAYAESTFVWTQKSSPVQKVTDSIPVTDEQLEDAAQVASLLDQRLRFGLRQRLDLQILVGDGTAPNLRGINNVVGIQTQAKGTEMAIVAFLRAVNKVRITGRASPNGAVFHPNDWLDILLTQNSNGDFLFGNPFQGPGPRSLFGIPVAESDAQTENTGLIADFANFTRVDDRRGVMVQTGFVGTQFTEGKVTLRADMRAAFTVLRPAAVCQLTGI